jgi:hypothetical protein
MRDEDDGRVWGMTRDEVEADMLAERAASAVRYVPMMTPEQLALYEARVRSAQTGFHDGPSPEA